MIATRRVCALFEPLLYCVLTLFFFAAGAVVLFWPRWASGWVAVSLVLVLVLVLALALAAL